MIYFDHAATTPVRAEVVDAMTPVLLEQWGNPSSVHLKGQEARDILDRSREKTAALLGARFEEITFTGSGTEANNLVLTGLLLRAPAEKRHLITSATEHHAVLHTAEWLRRFGADVTVLPVDEYGRVDPADVAGAIRPGTLAVSIMAANNEIGTLAPAAEIGKICREAGVYFHTDAVQWAGALPLRVDDFQADFLVITAHKFYGPKGAGALFSRRGTRLESLIHGGGQERGRRAGTENVAGAAGLARALELAVADQPETCRRIEALRDRMIALIQQSIPDAYLNGHPSERLPNNINFSFPGAESDLLVMNMDLEGIACSSGSACTAGALEPSHVIAALGVPHARAVSALRLSLGRSTSADEVETAAAVLQQVVARLRARDRTTADGV